jgi:hypothetical protein
MACQKVQFDDLDTARSRGSLLGLAAYRCRRCGYFHLTKEAQDKSYEERRRAEDAYERERLLKQSNRDAMHRARRLRMGK